MDASDLHCITNLGWIATVHDKNYPLAKKIFSFVKQHTQSPDIYLKLEQFSEAMGDTASQKQYASQFADKVDNSAYGLMYSKYLIDIYTGILNEPAKALALAEKDIINRPTPQVYAWYVWSLFCNGEKEKAYSVYKGAVSAKPLEGLELYYMGRMMQQLNKKYNANEYFNAAYKNRYDLSPGKVKFLKDNLE
jgi:hypothetical protein